MKFVKLMNKNPLKAVNSFEVLDIFQILWTDFTIYFIYNYKIKN